MARPRSKIAMTCQNHLCKFYLVEENKDIVKRGKNRAGHQQYFCNHCQKWFVETINTPLYHKHLSKSERITGHHRDTIGRLMGDVAEHAEKLNDFLIHDLKLSPIECDEFWTFIKKNKRKLSPKAQLSLEKVMHGSTPV